MTDIKILYEDDDLCVIEKPSGTVVNKSESTKEMTIQEWFEPRLIIGQSAKDSEFVIKGGVVHRLDKDASGILVLARKESVYEGLKEQFVNRKVEKVYLAMVHGKMKEKEGVVSMPIERNPNKKMRFFVGNDLSRTAVTFWKVLADSQDYSYLEIKILTGRTHQIRVHMKHLGHPLVADPLYGFVKTWKKDLEFCPRLFLHAGSLTFMHPKTGEVKNFTSPLPSDLVQALNNKINYNDGQW